MEPPPPPPRQPQLPTPPPQPRLVENKHHSMDTFSNFPLALQTCIICYLTPTERLDLAVTCHALWHAVETDSRAKFARIWETYLGVQHILDHQDRNVFDRVFEPFYRKMKGWQRIPERCLLHAAQKAYLYLLHVPYRWCRRKFVYQEYALHENNCVALVGPDVERRPCIHVCIFDYSMGMTSAVPTSAYMLPAYAKEEVLLVSWTIDARGNHNVTICTSRRIIVLCPATMECIHTLTHSSTSNDGDFKAVQKDKVSLIYISRRVLYDFDCVTGQARQIAEMPSHIMPCWLGVRLGVSKSKRYLLVYHDKGEIGSGFFVLDLHNAGIEKWFCGAPRPNLSSRYAPLTYYKADPFGHLSRDELTMQPSGELKVQTVSFSCNCYNSDMPLRNGGVSRDGNLLFCDIQKDGDFTEKVGNLSEVYHAPRLVHLPEGFQLSHGGNCCALTNEKALLVLLELRENWENECIAAYLPDSFFY